MTNHEAELDRMFQALADPTRRAVVERLARGPASVSELAQPFTMALPTLLQHLRVLEASGLVRSAKRGRVRTCAVEPQALQRVQGWLDRQRALWEARFDRLDALLAEEAETMEITEDTQTGER